MELNEDSIVSLIKAEGLLSQRLKGFEPRIPQQKMLVDTVCAYNDNKIALIEAGTGTGKSLAYLLPALIAAARHNERTVISTNTITLQEQLVNKDIPSLTKALNLTVKAVLAKGMNNYLCLRKLEDALLETRLLPPEDVVDLEKIAAWKNTTSEGSRSNLSFIPSQSTWERVGAESDNCSHHQCPYYQDCFFFKARRQANDANIIVSNHSLLFADLHRRAETNNYDSPCILPHYRRVILDEAHHIEDVATEYFALRVNRLELMRTLGRLSSEKQNKAFGKLPLLKEKIQGLFSGAPPTELSTAMSALAIDLPLMRRDLADQIHETFHTLSLFAEQLLPAAREEGNSGDIKLRLLPQHQSRMDWKDEVIPAVKRLSERLKDYIGNLSAVESVLKRVENDRLQEQTKGIRFEIEALAMRLESMSQLLTDFISESKDQNRVKWIETQKLRFLTNVSLVNAQLNIAPSLVDFLFSKLSTVVLCSATLTTNQSFSFIRERLGLTPSLLPSCPITESIYESPFDYQKQALLAVPTDIPLPSDPKFTDVAVEKIWEALHASRGNAFILFTSYTMLQECYSRLIDRLKEHRYHVFKQGDGPRHDLLNRFKTTNYSVLFGTDSFWEGVDVVGDALRCVVIVKLPFRVPTEPIIAARTEALTAEGKDPFMEYSVPAAIVKFKQGFGRLIRDRGDRGCIVCLDTRLITKKYGKLFLSSLPPCEQLFATSKQVNEEMQEFYKRTYHLTKR